MELGKIKARIREKGCNPSIPMVLPGSNKIIWVTVQKSSLMAELDKVFPTKVSETGLMFDGDKLGPAKGALVKSEPTPEQEAALTSLEAEMDKLFPLNASDEDDLLGGGQKDLEQLVSEMPDDDLLGPTDDDEDLLA